ncbi:MAG: hypothetical protein WCA58_14415 [Terriglobales bacterium]
MSPNVHPIRAVLIAAALLLAAASLASASATLLLEEPYGHMGFFTGTGHAAVYLSNVCANNDDPRVLRPCAGGETGVVLSRYDGVAGYDWLAIPLIPYLYAVDRPADIPLFADAKMVAFLRDSYRRKHLENIVPDNADRTTPAGNWYQLIGSSYDRTIYGFEIDTTPEQDAALIRHLNSSPNQSHFHLLTRNCADFAKDIINFYYPKSLHRSVVADVGITTPKQISKLLARYEARHPSLAASRLVIAQVPGSMPRSSNPKGVVESFLKSKKYIVPSAIASPIFAGCVVAVYVGTGAGRFQPDQDALVFNPGSNPEPPIARKDRKAYEREFKQLLAETDPAAKQQGPEKAWEHLQSKARTGFDDQQAPVLQMHVGEQQVSLGVSAGNIFNGTAPPQLVQQIIEARLQSELHHAPPKGLSQQAITRDWTLLQQTMSRQATLRESTLASAQLTSPQPASAQPASQVSAQQVSAQQASAQQVPATQVSATDESEPSDSSSASAPATSDLDQRHFDGP